jgi:CheY-like chemotaxis protein
LQQALLNFVGNAIKFTENGSVTLRVIETESSESRVVLRFEIVDTGIGIEAEAIARLFNSFEQADSSTTRRFGGSGLGLAISKKIAEAMGGEAGVQSTPGAGSTFWMTGSFTKGGALQAGLVEVPGEDALLAIQQRFAGRRVLLVEDEPINREIATVLIEDAGLVVSLAEDGLIAVDLVANGVYDLVLMDMQMPRMGGLEATRKIRQLPNGQSLRIIAMTANAFASDRADCMAAGMDDFLSKPINPDLLFVTLLKWLDNAKV